EYYLAANSPARGAATDGSDIGARQGNYCDSLFIAVYADSLPVDTTQNGTPESPYATIQAAIDVSLDGDTVMVLPGTYIGEGNRNIRTLGKAITVMGEKGPDSTIIDIMGEEYDGFIFDYDTDEDSTTIISGFTINSAFNAVNIEYAAPLIENCILQNCSSIGIRGYYSSKSSINSCQFISNAQGIFLRTGDLDIDNCTFRAHSGNAIYFDGPQSGSITNCKFIGNQTIAAYILSIQPIPIENCLFDSNFTAMHGSFDAINDTIRNGVNGIDGDLFSSGCCYSATNCLFENLSGYVMQGAGYAYLYNCNIINNPGQIGKVWWEEHVSFYNCSFGNNTGLGIISSGPGAHFRMDNCIYINNSSPVVIETAYDITIDHCTFADNLCTPFVLMNNYVEFYFKNCISAFNEGSGIEVDTVIGGAFATDIGCCNIFANDSGNYSIIDDQTGINGNISLDPRFCNSDTADYHLAANSPCAPENNVCSTLIGVLPVGCGPVLHVWHIDTAGSDIFGDGSEGNPFATLNKAVSLSNDEDTILIHSGIYTGAGNTNVLIDKKLYVRGAGKDSTIFNIDNNDSDWTIWQNISYDSSEIAVSGISINSARYGMNLVFTKVSLKSVVFENNTSGISVTYGAGLRSYIDSCEFIGNGNGYSGFECTCTALRSIFRNNTGFAISAQYDVIANECEFYNNYAAIGSGNFLIDSCIIEGGSIGLWCTTTHCNITANNCEISGLTGNVFVLQCGLNITNCIIRNNEGSITSNGDDDMWVHINNCVFYKNGGGISFPGVNASYDIINCLYASNGGPIYQYQSTGALTIDNCTFANNPNGAIYSRALCDVGSSIIANNGIYGINYESPLYDCTISECNIYNNDSDFIDPMGLIDMTCVISIDPEFCCPDSGNYWVTGNSPCLAANNSCGVLIGKYGVGCVEPCVIFICGDANGSQSVNILDVTFIISYLYKGGPPPDPADAADVNNDGAINILDVTYLISYLYKGGPEPICN
ncbi:MAG: right-handed parallel beta-helix repeat-containing protein, partial [Candidatus Zixiibacteriota bacterium]